MRYADLGLADLTMVIDDDIQEKAIEMVIDECGTIQVIEQSMWGGLIMKIGHALQLERRRTVDGLISHRAINSILTTSMN